MRSAGQPVFDVEMIDRLAALAHDLNPLNAWRAKSFGHSSARVFIVGNRLRVFWPVGRTA